MKHIELEYIGISTSALENNDHIVLLGEKNGTVQLPIMVNKIQASAISVAIGKMPMMCPHIQDLFKKTKQSWQVDLTGVLINELRGAVFHAVFLFKGEHTKIEIDALAAHAITMAISLHLPIYIEADLFNKLAMAFRRRKIKFKTPIEETNTNTPSIQTDQNNLQYLDIATLQQMLTEVVEKEDYIQAIALRDAINSKKIH